MIVKNSWLDGKWEREERSEIHTDFMPSRSFHMAIECGDVSYNVFLNGKFIAEFRFRTKPEIVDTVYIQGDITLKHVSHEVKGETQWLNLIEKIDRTRPSTMNTVPVPCYRSQCYQNS